MTACHPLLPSHPLFFISHVENTAATHYKDTQRCPKGQLLQQPPAASFEVHHKQRMSLAAVKNDPMATSASGCARQEAAALHRRLPPSVGRPSRPPMLVM